LACLDCALLLVWILWTTLLSRDRQENDWIDKVKFGRGKEMRVAVEGRQTLIIQKKSMGFHNSIF
jgi:hypothetical protein